MGLGELARRLDEIEDLLVRRFDELDRRLDDRRDLERRLADVERRLKASDDRRARTRAQLLADAPHRFRGSGSAFPLEGEDDTKR